jgi:import inner membrane translocase subunit TIM22
MAQDDLMNNCAVRTGLSCVMGAGLGVVFGVFMGTMDAAGGGLDGGVGAAPAPTAPGATPPPPATARQTALAMARSVGSRSASYAKGFAAMGALFAGAECVVEKARARHDAWNAVYAGCAAGGALASPAGAKAAAVGCASFAAFSAFIDRMMDH